MTTPRTWTHHANTVAHCRRCPRLTAWREETARTKVRRFQEEDYWGRPVPGFGDPDARLLIVGLAPAAHGGNRTGRMFTGDKSGEWLYRALFEFGFANQPDSSHRGDGLELTDCYITAACRCAPPLNKPLPEELAACRPFLAWEFQHLKNLRIVLGLGRVGFLAALREISAQGNDILPPRPSFAHGESRDFPGGLTLVGSYHPSQQNTFTGKLTRPMFHSVFAAIRQKLGPE